MPEDEFLLLITSREWRNGLVELLRAHLSPATARNSAEVYLSRNKDVPASIVRALLEPPPKKKRGRHATVEAYAKQLASDIICFLATEHLRKKGNWKPSRIYQEVAELTFLTRQSVDGARKRGKLYLRQLKPARKS